MPREAVIRVRDLVVGFGTQTVLNHVSLAVERGEIFGLVGGSGSGKSVLLRTVIGLIPAREGRIEVLGTVRGALGVFRANHLEELRLGVHGRGAVEMEVGPDQDHAIDEIRAVTRRLRYHAEMAASPGPFTVTAPR